jgi:ribulose-5-phosphate 4-epimerase/fuculose-1-phosphate aldolase
LEKEHGMDDSLTALQAEVALACRVLAQTGVVREILGHVSARVPGTDEMFIRCRGIDEYGLAFTDTDAIRRLHFDGSGEGRGPHHEPPHELPIHGEILRARPEVGAVVHAHPTAVLLCGLSGVELRPIFGAYDPFAMALAWDPIPIYPRSILITTPALARELIDVMGQNDVCILRGHGIAVTGRTVREATLRAIRLEHLAQVCWQLAQRGPLPEMRSDDREAFAGFLAGLPTLLPRGDDWVWRSYVRLLTEPTSNNRGA